MHGSENEGRRFEEGILLDVEHVFARSTKKVKQEMTLFERFVTEGNERADELAKDRAMKEKWRRQGPARFSRKGRMYTRHCSTQPAFTVWWRNGATVQSSSRSRKTKGGQES